MADKKKIKSEASSSTSTIENVKSESVVVDVGRRRSSCGYCKSGSDTSITHGYFLIHSSIRFTVLFNLLISLI
ncbi:putative arginyltransferase [Helianthus annuus]|nr:putative arginyltransferase [Helianthus annuus]